MVGSGQMWVAPQAESHPQAISMRSDAAGVDADLLLRYYLPPDAPSLPEPFRIGKATGTVTMAGSHLSPEVQVRGEEGRRGTGQWLGGWGEHVRIGKATGTVTMAGSHLSPEVQVRGIGRSKGGMVAGGAGKGEGMELSGMAFLGLARRRAQRRWLALTSALRCR